MVGLGDGGLGLGLGPCRLLARREHLFIANYLLCEHNYTTRHLLRYQLLNTAKPVFVLKYYTVYIEVSDPLDICVQLHYKYKID